ncbi:hypothetical protein AB0J83_11850 [Actinoplanes sp. NPDC049596]|uniref:hypothetical protein n=1 Tax=unclassified Actinoplanes TaxID=2626549 RepID=UPI0034166984
MWGPTAADPWPGAGRVASADLGGPGTITIWDVAAAEPLFPPAPTTDDGGLGAFGRLGDRLVAAHGVDTSRNEEIWPEAEADIYLRDLTTGELLTHHRPDAGYNQQLLFTRLRGRDVVLVAADGAEGGTVRIWEIVPTS